MKKIPAVLLVLGSIPFFLFGIMFLISAASKPMFFWVGLAGLALATAMLVGGLRWLRKLAAISPDTLKTGAVELARRMGGELTISQLRAEFRISRELATETLEKLVAEGVCAREQREERFVYVFTGLLPSLAEKVCPYCGAQLPVRSALRKCPNCGAGLEIVKT
jgi:rubrerythrin